jgi:hypothetical protein
MPGPHSVGTDAASGVSVLEHIVQAVWIFASRYLKPRVYFTRRVHIWRNRSGKLVAFVIRGTHFINIQLGLDNRVSRRSTGGLQPGLALSREPNRRDRSRGDAPGLPETRPLPGVVLESFRRMQANGIRYAYIASETQDPIVRHLYVSLQPVEFYRNIIGPGR